MADVTVRDLAPIGSAGNHVLQVTDGQLRLEMILWEESPSGLDNFGPHNLHTGNRIVAASNNPARRGPVRPSLPSHRRREFDLDRNSRRNTILPAKIRPESLVIERRGNYP